MAICRGFVPFQDVEEALGYRLTPEDEILWNQFYAQKADLSDKESCFMAFYTPRVIIIKGEPAKEALLAMFTPNKKVSSKMLFRIFMHDQVSHQTLWN